MLSANRAVFKSLTLQSKGATLRHKSFLPSSPVKMISQFLSGGATKDPDSPSKPRAPQQAPKDIPTMLPPVRLPSRSGSQKLLDDEKAASKVTLVGAYSNDRPHDPLRLLEETFATFMLSLRLRSGNVVGRLLRNRTWADKLAVNELYNTLRQCCNVLTFQLQMLTAEKWKIL